MKASWESAIAHVLAVEGGYVDLSDDRGGPTNFGVTWRTLSAWFQRPVAASEVEHLDPGTARLIYKDRFWDLMRGDELPIGVDLMVFDAAVHAGQGQATRWLQQAIGVENDGVFGSRTLTAARAAPALETVRKIAFMRVLESFDDPSDAPNTRGWVDRILKTLVEAVELSTNQAWADNPP